jgi:hypothetical protein
MSLKIENETVYVIYKNGVPYEGDGRKLVYTSTSAANGVITKEAKREAEHGWLVKRDYLNDADWYELSRKSREILIDKVKDEFTIVEYGPKEWINNEGR